MSLPIHEPRTSVRADDTDPATRKLRLTNRELRLTSRELRLTSRELQFARTNPIGLTY